MTTLQTTFETIFNNVAKVSYNPTWANGTGYFDGAVRQSLCPVGTMVGSVDPTGRRLLLRQVTHDLCVIVFERYSPDSGSRFVLVKNEPRRWDMFDGKPIVDEKQLRAFAA